MNVSKLKIGNNGNYKNMCHSLDEKTKTGKSRTLQLNEWSRYFKYTKEGHSFIIHEIYGEPKPRQDNRTNGNKSIFKDSSLVDSVELMLLNSASDECMALPKHVLHREVALTNRYYKYLDDNRYYIKALKGEEYDKELTSYYFDRVGGSLERVVETALNNLKKRKLITWHHAKVKVVTNTTNNEPVHYLCTRNECDNIRHAEREVLNKYGYDNTYKVNLMGKNERNKFYNEVQSILNEKFEMYYTFSYSAYEIRFTKAQIEKDLSNRGLLDIDRKECVKLTFTNHIRKEMDKQVKNAQEKIMSYKEFKSKCFGGRAKDIQDTSYALDDVEQMVIKDEFMNMFEELMEITINNTINKELESQLVKDDNIIITSKVLKETQDMNTISVNKIK